MNTVLVTGGAGFIGTNLTYVLTNSNTKVIIFDNLSRRGSEKNLKWLKANCNKKYLEIVIGDIRDFSLDRKLIKKVDVVYHLAAQVAVTKSFENPREDFEVNALGSFNILEAARQSNHKPVVIFASTNKVYGQLKDSKIGKTGVDETYPLDFHSPYACSNGVADQYTRDYFRVYGLKTIVFRQSCIYGPHQMGVEDQGWVAHFAKQIIWGKPITIYGDGKQVRDLLYVDDLLSAYIDSVKAINKTKGQIYNIGGGVSNAYSLLEIVRILELRLGKKAKVKYGKERKGDQMVFITNIQKARKDFGFIPKTSVDKGIEGLITWLK